MERRDVLRFGLAGAAGSLFIPSTVMAAAGFEAGGLPMAGGVYYTKERPGRWAKKVSSHLPVIKRAGGRIEVRTRHPQEEYKHYIVKHTVLDDKFQYVSEVMFDPAKGEPVSSHEVGKLRGIVYVTSMCNIHDVWLNALKL